ncbi:MAG: hypothetical protein EHM49_01055 [Deltaproteobacteria bacterium]|nr:MAG: hypothetical protein EHM49_01055 [Deltaproteobacteria bacterium]
MGERLLRTLRLVESYPDLWKDLTERNFPNYQKPEEYTIMNKQYINRFIDPPRNDVEKYYNYRILLAIATEANHLLHYILACKDDPNRDDKVVEAMKIHTEYERYLDARGLERRPDGLYKVL